jgi:hypothetical protein
LFCCLHELEVISNKTDKMKIFFIVIFLLKKNPTSR